MDDIRNGVSGYVKHGGERGERVTTFVKNITNRFNVFFCKLTHAVLFTSNWPEPTFLHFIGVVERFRSNFKVKRVDTTRVVTSMHNEAIGWDFSFIMKLKGYVRSWYNFSVFISNFTVSRCIEVADPRPTIFASTNDCFIAHSLFNRAAIAFFKSIFVSSHSGNCIRYMGICQ